MKNIKLFETEAEYAAYEDNLDLPNVSHVRESGNNYFHPYERDYSREYLTYEVLEDGLMAKMVQVQGENVPSAYTVSYSLNGGEWLELPDVDLENPDPSTFIPVSEGDIVRFKGNNNAMANYIDDSNMSNCMIAFSDSTMLQMIRVNVYGNIMSMLYGDDFINQDSFPNGSSYNFLGFFMMQKVIDASNLILPVTALTIGCYYYMFINCNLLVNAPELPATTLAENCYRLMFEWCDHLTTAPALPATTLANGCYSDMFCYCLKLTTAPELPATTLANSCYMGMFYACSSLNYIKCLATDISATGCTSSWVSGVAASGTFVKSPNMSSWTTGVGGIPNGWTVVDAS